jgi:class 3 adenylate cyclase
MEARDGVLDLRDWVPSEQAITLDGAWRFHPGVLLEPGESPEDAGLLMEVPSPWEDPVGVGTYRLRVELPPDTPPLQLHIASVGGAARGWVDDTPIPEIGVVGTKAENTYESASGASLTFTPPDSGAIELTIQVSNAQFRLGGLHRGIELSSGAHVERRLIRRYLWHGTSLAVTATMALGFLGLAIMRRDPTSLYFTCYCLTLFVRELVTGYPPILDLLVDDLPRIPVLHVEYATIPFGTVFALGLIGGFSRISMKQPWIRALQATGLVLGLVTLINPPRWDGLMLRVDQAWMVIVLTILLGMLVWAARSGVLIAKALLGLTALTGLAFIHDILVSTEWLSSTVRLTAPGFLLYLGGIGWLMTRRFAQTLTRVEVMAAELREAHTRLEQTHRSVLRFVPVEFLHFLGRDAIEQVERGDRTDLTLTIQFSDIRSFTTLTENLSPEETFTLVGDYLQQMGTPVQRHDGFIDKYIGDAVMALFPQPDAALQSCIDQLAAVDASNAERAARGALPIDVGFGLHTGPVTLGTVGSSERLDCTVLGDAVNLASRVEGLTSRYRTRLLVTEDVVSSLERPDAVTLREIDRVVVKGRTEAVRVLEVLEALPDARRARREAALTAFNAGRDALFEGRFADAVPALEAALDTDPDDQAAVLLLNRARDLLEAGETEPGAAIERMTRK